MNAVAGSFTVDLIGAVLVVLGVALVWTTVVFWRGSTEDNEVLAPLEVMGDRRFGRLDDSDKLALLNDVRPVGVQPVAQYARNEVVTVDDSGARIVDRTEDFDHRYRRFSDLERLAPSPPGGVRRPGRRRRHQELDDDFAEDPAHDRDGDGVRGAEHDFDDDRSEPMERRPRARGERVRRARPAPAPEVGRSRDAGSPADPTGGADRPRRRRPAARRDDPDDGPMIDPLLQ